MGIKQLLQFATHALVYDCCTSVSVARVHASTHHFVALSSSIAGMQRGTSVCHQIVMSESPKNNARQRKGERKCSFPWMPEKKRTETRRWAFYVMMSDIVTSLPLPALAGDLF